MGRNIKSAFYRLRNNPRHVAAVVDGRGHLVGSIRIDDIARYIAKR
jgi:Mg/Co/Ni transporter MgtE